jgi:hypothetical protein
LTLALDCSYVAVNNHGTSRPKRDPPGLPQLTTAEGLPCPRFDPSDLDEWDSCAYSGQTN